MPILKVSENLQKYSMEVARLPLTIITNCPQCRSTSYENGTCEDCAYIDPRYQASYAAWQEAQMAQQQLNQPQKKKKAASKLANIDAFTEMKTTKVPCPRCGQTSFSVPDTGKKIKKQDWYKNGGECTNPECTWEKAPKGLGFNSKDFAGIDNEWLKSIGGIRQNFKPVMTFAASKIEENKNILKESAPDQQFNPGAFLDDSIAVTTDKTTRMKKMLQTNAQLETQQQAQEQLDGNSEEQ